MPGTNEQGTDGDQPPVNETPPQDEEPTMMQMFAAMQQQNQILMGLVQGGVHGGIPGTRPQLVKPESAPHFTGPALSSGRSVCASGNNCTVLRLIRDRRLAY